MRAAVSKSRHVVPRCLPPRDRSRLAAAAAAAAAAPRRRIGSVRRRAAAPPRWAAAAPLPLVQSPTDDPRGGARGALRRSSSVAAVDGEGGGAGASAAEPTSASAGATGTVPFLLADIGEGIAEVELLQWYVQPGDDVRQFQEVCQVQSDKATVDITSRYDGEVADLCGAPGDMISVGSPLMHIAVEGGGNGGGGVGAAAPTLHNVDDEADRLHIPPVASSFPEYPSGDDDDDGGPARPARAFASPAVRKLGRDHGIDLSHIAGTGPNGRILKADLLKIVGSREIPRTEPAAAAAAVAGATMTTARAAAGEPTREEPSPSTLASQPRITPGEDTIVPLRGYARLMVKSMAASLRVPHMVYSDEVDMGNLRSARAELRPLAEAGGVRLSFMPFLIKAASLAMGEHPVLNSSIDAEGKALTYHGDHDIGVAVDTPRGLAVPVVRRCQELSVLDIAKELNRLQSLAVEGNLTEADIAGPTFSLSNIGAIGGTYMSPIVSPPQVAIGAMGRIQRLPRFVGDTTEVEEAHVMQISWGGDHRVIDGATMARFSNAWKGYVEKPVSMTLVMK